MAVVNHLFCSAVIGGRNIAALDEIYTENARILPPGAPMISGREAIKQFWASLIDAQNATYAVLSSIDVMPAADGVVEIGEATLTFEAPGQPPVQVEVKYVVYWRKENGNWKWHVDIWNPNT